MIISSKYILEISCKTQENALKIQDIIFGNIDSRIFQKWKNKISIHSSVLQFEVTETEKSEYFDFINIFLDILEGKYDEIESVGVTREDIIIWCYSKFSIQYNTEFSSKRMKRLGENGITLCLSVIDMSGDDYMEIGGVRIKKEDWF